MSGPDVVDARGLRCPLPVIRMARAAEGLPAQALLQVLATDPAAEHDVPAWARMRGHRVVRSERDDDGGLRITVELGTGEPLRP
ncbi:MAG: sulfurtransferase TusA family protein [Angustibacter sp.]